MDTDSDTLVIARYVKIEDDAAGIVRLPGRPPNLSHAELICLAVMQAMLAFTSQARRLRHVRAHLGHLFPFVPQQPGCNKRLRAALPQIKRLIRTLAADTDFWHDTVWIADSTPVECGRSRFTIQLSQMAGWADHGYCRSHSRWFWGLRLYLLCTPAGMPITWALASPRTGRAGGGGRDARGRAGPGGRPAGPAARGRAAGLVGGHPIRAAPRAARSGPRHGDLRQDVGEGGVVVDVAGREHDRRRQAPQHRLDRQCRRSCGRTGTPQGPAKGEPGETNPASGRRSGGHGAA
ncbi:hypothetical protein Acsp04_55520 [Actinomadura sp. NBRC 104425]|nr:hypothetical protein Acsp04_55520 [Actinomadura sp. NBRC 104425]